MSFAEKKQNRPIHQSIQHVRIFNAIAIYLTNKQHPLINKDWVSRTEELQSSRVLGSGDKRKFDLWTSLDVMCF